MATESDPEFGPVLLDQKPNKGNIGNAIFLLIVGLPFAAVVFIPAAPLGARLLFFTLGGGLSVFAAVMLRRNWMHVVLQQSGIVEYRQGRRRRLAYQDVEELIFSSMRIFAHGSYIHTIHKLALGPADLPPPYLVATLIFKERDVSAGEAQTPITLVRDRLSQQLAASLYETVRREQSVDWSPEVRISGPGLDVADGRGGWELIAWPRIRQFDWRETNLRCWIDKEPAPRREISSTRANFYPAFELALRLRREATTKI